MIIEFMIQKEKILIIKKEAYCLMSKDRKHILVKKRKSHIKKIVTLESAENPNSKHEIMIYNSMQPLKAGLSSYQTDCWFDGGYDPKDFEPVKVNVIYSEIN